MILYKYLQPARVDVLKHRIRFTQPGARKKLLASAIQIVRPLESIAETHPQLQRLRKSLASCVAG
jgi:hypothetical protein